MIGTSKHPTAVFQGSAYIPDTPAAERRTSGLAGLALGLDRRIGLPAGPALAKIKSLIPWGFAREVKVHLRRRVIWDMAGLAGSCGGCGRLY